MNLPWFRSYNGTPQFNTVSGWLDPGTYALVDNGNSYLVLDASSPSIPGITGDLMPLSTDVSGLTQVQQVGEQGFDEFVLPSGKIYQQPQSPTLNTSLGSSVATPSDTTSTDTTPTCDLVQTDIDTLEQAGVQSISTGIGYDT